MGGDDEHEPNVSLKFIRRTDCMSDFVNSEIQTPSRFTLPRVSVVIPMFNAEKFLGECLESILSQTFQNFEVIIVDDCSTDSSCAIVESYAEKFGGRLTLAHMEKKFRQRSRPAQQRLVTFSRRIYFLHGQRRYAQADRSRRTLPPRKKI